MLFRWYQRKPVGNTADLCSNCRFVIRSKANKVCDESGHRGWIKTPLGGTPEIGIHKGRSRGTSWGTLTFWSLSIRDNGIAARAGDARLQWTSGMHPSVDVVCGNFFSELENLLGSYVILRGHFERSRKANLLCQRRMQCLS
jgi:hypothetical protein